MNKKKAIKILGATAIAASAFVATAPIGAEAASVNEVKTLVKKAKDAGTVLKWAISTEGSADGQTRPWAQYNAAKAERDKAVAAINTLPAAQRAAYLTDIEQNVNLHITRTMHYIDAITAGEKINVKKEALASQIEKNLIDEKTEAAYHELSTEIRKQAILLDRVYGQTTRDEIRNNYKKSAEAVRDSVKHEVSAKIELDLAKKAIEAKDAAAAEKHVAKAVEYMKEVKNAAMKAELTKTLAEVEAELTPAVTAVTDLTRTGVTVTIPAATEDIEGFTVDVLDNNGNKVAVTAIDVVKGQTEVFLKFSTALTADPTGVWTVGNVKYDLDVLKQVSEILAHSSAFNEVKLYDALQAGKIQGVKVASLQAYATEIITSSADTLAKIQTAVNKVNDSNVTVEEKIAVLGNIFDAKASAVQLRSALNSSPFERVNAEWVSVAGPANDYTEAVNVVFTGVTAKADITTANAAALYTSVQTAIDTVNTTNIDAFKLTVTDTAKATAYKNLIVSYVKNDAANETVKADKLAAADHTIALSELKATTSPVEAYRLLVKLLNVNTKDNFTTALLNENNKQEYYNSLVTYQPTITIHTATDTTVADIVTHVITAGDNAALTSAKTAIENIVDNTALTGQPDNGTALATVKANLKKLADVTSHKTGVAKFDFSIVKDDKLAEYRTALKDMTVSSAVAAITTAVQNVNNTADLNVYLKTVSESNDVTAVTNALTNLAAAGTVTSYLNVNSAVKAELSQIIIAERNEQDSAIVPADAVNKVLTAEEIFGATNVWANTSNLFDGATAAHTAKLTAFNTGLGDVTTADTTAIVTGIKTFVEEGHAFNSLSVSKQLEVAEAFKAHKIVTGVQNGVEQTRGLDFTSTDAITTIAKGNEWINKFIAQVN